MPFSLAAQVVELKQGDHVCAVYDDPTDQLRALARYVGVGLDTAERCVYIIDERSAGEIRAALQAEGVTVGDALSNGRLRLLTSRETYLQSGQFDPHAMVRFLRDATEEALRDGCTGLRVAGEMTWALGPEIGCDRVLEYESLLNRFFPGSRAHAICQYNGRRFSPNVIRHVLQRHPIAILGDYVCPNIFYEPPEVEGVGPEAEERRTGWMIQQLQRARASEIELQQRTRELAEAVRARDDFLSMASHELKTPVNSLRLALRVLSLSPSASSANESIRRAQRQVERLAQLVDGLLDITHVAHGRLELHLEPVDLYAVVQAVAVRLELDANEAGSELIVEGAPTIGTWDPLRIEQIIGNLISNAIKYGEGRPITITVASSDREAIVAVRDQGIGIAPERQVDIFERFSRAVSPQSYGGLGLGLWIARELAQLLGGRIEVASGPGPGSTFTVTLPKTPGV